MESRPLVGLVAVDLPDTEEVDGCRVRVVGIGGGPMDVRVLDAPGRVVFVPAAEVRVFDGVVVRDGAPLEVADPSCFVGDLVGDLSIPEDGRDPLGPGLGLGAFRLILLVNPESVAARPVPGLKLLGRLGLRAAGFAVAGAWAMMANVVGRTNMPWPIPQSKYRSP